MALGANVRCLKDLVVCVLYKDFLPASLKFERSSPFGEEVNWVLFRINLKVKSSTVGG